MKHASCSEFRASRRHLLKTGLGLFGLALPQFLGLRGRAAEKPAPAAGFGRAKSCIVFFSWGGMSQLDTWDPKPDAPVEVRGEFGTIATAVPGIRLAEPMPLLARQMGRLAVVRSVCHKAAGHRNAAYWNLTGHPPAGNVADDTAVVPSRKDWPCLGAQAARFKPAAKGFPGTVMVPSPMADRGLLNGQYGGFLGMTCDPLLLRPDRGRPYAGVSPNAGAADLHLPEGVDAIRMGDRRSLASLLDGASPETAGTRALTRYREMASDLLLSPQVAAAFDLEREDPRLRDRYGDHICGQSALLARRLTESGVPLVTVVASAGDLNGGSGDHWDTHGDNFRRLRRDLLPPMEQAGAALLDDLDARGLLDETLVVWMTEFGRTPQVQSGGRNHYPFCYSTAFAGGGIRGGRVYGRSDRHAATPAEAACGPHDLQATILHALGIAPEAQVEDNLGRPLALTEGEPLPLF
jgi:hypothetical protein